MTQVRTKLKQWLGSSLVIFLFLILIHLALPGLLLLLQVPSFTIGGQTEILRWQNDETGTGIQFNLLVLLGIAMILSWLITLIKASSQRGNRTQNRTQR